VILDRLRELLFEFLAVPDPDETNRLAKLIPA
jgi:hypothetical protein